MPDSVAKDIANNVRTSLQNINGVDPYNIDLGNRVYLYGRRATRNTERPAIVIHYAGESGTTLGDATVEGYPVVIGTYTNAMRLALVVSLSEGDEADASDLAQDAVHDVKTALMADETRGSKALDTIITEVDPAIPADGFPDFEITMTVVIVYRHGATNPAVTTPTT